MRCGHKYWDKTIELAEACSWKAGSFLARQMQENDFADNERVIIAREGDRIAGFCTFANRDEIPEDLGFTPFIGFVFVEEHFRGHRLSKKMIEAACAVAREQGISKVHIMSGEKGLYEKYGFTKIGDYKTVYGTIDQLFIKNI